MGGRWHHSIIHPYSPCPCYFLTLGLWRWRGQRPRRIWKSSLSTANLIRSLIYFPSVASLVPPQQRHRRFSNPKRCVKVIDKPGQGASREWWCGTNVANFCCCCCCCEWMAELGIINYNKIAIFHRMNPDDIVLCSVLLQQRRPEQKAAAEAEQKRTIATGLAQWNANFVVALRSRLII